MMKFIYFIILSISFNLLTNDIAQNQKFLANKQKRIEVGKKIIDIIKKLDDSKRGIHLFNLSDFNKFFGETLDALEKEDDDRYNEDITETETHPRPNWIHYKLYLLKLEALEVFDFFKKNPKELEKIDQKDKELLKHWKELSEQIEKYQEIYSHH